PSSLPEPAETQTVEPLVIDHTPAPPLAGIPAPAMTSTTLRQPEAEAVERALASQQAGQHTEVVETAVPHLEPGTGGPRQGAAFSRAAPWAPPGLSRPPPGGVGGAAGAPGAPLPGAPRGVSGGRPAGVAAPRRTRDSPAPRGSRTHAGGIVGARGRAPHGRPVARVADRRVVGHRGGVGAPRQGARDSVGGVHAGRPRIAP